MKINIKFKKLSLPKLSAKNVVKIALGGFFLLLVGTFVAWRVATYLGAVVKETGNGATITWTVSDHSLSGSKKIPLPNSTTDTTTPNYEELNGATPLTVTGSTIQLPRYQGNINYK